jgi:hypothetical protein
MGKKKKLIFLFKGIYKRMIIYGPASSIITLDSKKIYILVSRGM